MTGVRSPGLAARIALSQLVIVALALASFALTLGIAVARESVAVGERVDVDLAQRLAPLIERAYRQPDSIGRLDELLERAERPMPMMRTMRSRIPELPIQPIVVATEDGTILDAVSLTPGERAEAQAALTGGRVRLSSAPVVSVPGGRSARVLVGSMIRPGVNPLAERLTAVMIRAGAITAVLVALGTLLLTVIWSRLVVRPLTALSRTSVRLAAGDRAVRAPLPRGQHELRSLAESFNAMADALQTHEEQQQQFIADAAHELRTPIALISGRVEMLAEGVYPASREQWRLLSDDIERMSALVSDLQALARLESEVARAANREIVSVGQIISRARGRIEPMAEGTGVHVDYDVHDCATAELFVSPSEIGRTLDNLLANALRHAGEHGTVWVSATSDSGSVVIAVENSGLPIALEDRERIFERFTRLDDGRARDAGGAGLGLAIARRIAEQHGGTVTVAEPQRRSAGARFELRLPIAEQRG